MPEIRVGAVETHQEFFHRYDLEQALEHLGAALSHESLRTGDDCMGYHIKQAVVNIRHWQSLLRPSSAKERRTGSAPVPPAGSTDRDLIRRAVHALMMADAADERLRTRRAALSLAYAETCLRSVWAKSCTGNSTRGRKENHGRDQGRRVR